MSNTALYMSLLNCIFSVSKNSTSSSRVSLKMHSIRRCGDSNRNAMREKAERKTSGQEKGFDLEVFTDAVFPENPIEFNGQVAETPGGD